MSRARPAKRAAPPLPRDVDARIDAALARREPLFRRGDLEAVRLVNGAGDGLPGIHVDQLGPFLLAHVEEGAAFGPVLKRLLERRAPHAVFERVLRRNPSARRPEELEPTLLFAESTTAAPGELLVRERDLLFLVRARDGSSPGLFIDQRDNRDRVAALARGRLARADGAAGCTVLNTFAHTCAFSVAAAKAGACTVSVDLSARYLDWGRTNFAANRLDPAPHEFVRGDALTFLRIAAKRGRRFDLVILDPPTFSTSRQSGTFQVERDYARLFELAVRAAAPGAALLCSHNQRSFARRALASKLAAGAESACRRVVSLEPFHPPADFPGPEPENPAARGFWATIE
jgi:23S rRNA (cytosine1962-C5)-methyltransferase